MNFLGSILLWIEAHHRLVMLCIDISCIFSPSLGYLDQLTKIIKTRTSENFKIDSSIVLLLSNYLRIIYWYWKQFDTYLLFQSIWMISVQLTLAYLYYFFKPEGKKSTLNDQKIPNTLFFEQFYAKTFLEFMGYVTIIALVLLLLSILLHTIFDSQIIIESIGIVSNLIDCIVTLPQFILVVIRRNIRYVTVFLLLQWSLAVGCKLVLFIMRPVPFPFMIGLAIQGFLTFFVVTFYIGIRISRKNKPINLENDTIDYRDPIYGLNFEDVDLDSHKESL